MIETYYNKYAKMFREAKTLSELEKNARDPELIKETNDLTESQEDRYAKLCLQNCYVYYKKILRRK